MTRAWELFPEYRHDAVRTHVHQIKYLEIDWLNGRTVIVKKKPQPQIPIFKIEEPNAPRKRKERDEERAE